MIPAPTTKGFLRNKRKIASLRAAVNGGTTEDRIASLNSAQNGFKTAEMDLQNLRRDVDEKFGVLRKITQSELTQKPVDVNSAITPTDIDVIKKLKRNGWRNEEIAKKLNRSLTEIDLALQINADE
mgnify:CR=1 FL=1